jgi:hypothetical protein
MLATYAMGDWHFLRMKIHAAAAPFRKRIAVASFFAALFGLAAMPCPAQQLTPVWVEVGPDGAPTARVIVNAAGDCPTVEIDGTSERMTLRPHTPPGFRPACELAIPATAKSVSANGHALVLPQPDPSRIIAFGDTGCRIKGSNVQDCDDPAKWPFRQIATQASLEKPALVIHVGDYLYRESPCPAGSEALCGGTPAGDNWDAWNADFFTPAAKLLAAAPWAFSRGNHEDCTRSWRGWFYYLDPRPWSGMCETYSPPYLIKLGAFELVMLDSSPVNELGVDEDQITEYTGQLLSLHPQNAWLVDHHPFWGFASVAGSLPPIPISAPLEEAWNRTNPKGYALILSGHIHLFEFLNLGQGRPDQLVVGDGGTAMAAPIQTSIQGIPIRGVTTDLTETDHQFGYTLFTKEGSGWKLVLKNGTGEPLVTCQIPGGIDSCKTLPIK